MLSLELHQQWYFEKLRSGTFTDYGPWELTPRFKVYDDYVESLKKNGVARRANETELKMRLRQLMPEGFPKKEMVIVSEFAGPNKLACNPDSAARRLPHTL